MPLVMAWVMGEPPAGRGAAVMSPLADAVDAFGVEPNIASWEVPLFGMPAPALLALLGAGEPRGIKLLPADLSPGVPGGCILA